MDRSEKQKMQAGELYRADDAELLADAALARLMMEEFNRRYPDDPDQAQQTLRSLFRYFGDAAHVRPPLRVDYGQYISFGDRSFANYGLIALDVAPITIGCDVQIGPNVQLLTPTHPFDASLRKQKFEAAEPIAIADNAWLGGGVIVLPGVSIGENSVIGAGSVVSKDIPSNVVAVGNPARIIKTL